MRGDPGEVVAVPRDPAGVGGFEAGDGPQQGGLPAAGRTEHGEHLAVREGQRDVHDGGPAVVRHGDVTESSMAQKAPTDGTRRRSTASITSAVVAASTTEAASAIP